MGAVRVFKVGNYHNQPQVPVLLRSPSATGVNFAAQSKVLRLLFD